MAAIAGSIVLLFGLVLVGYTMYAMVAHTPASTEGWVFSALYIIGGLIVAYYGYQLLYPPVLIMGGRRRW